jgi:hypothetical protein
MNCVEAFSVSRKGANCNAAKKTAFTVLILNEHSLHHFLCDLAILASLRETEINTEGTRKRSCRL